MNRQEAIAQCDALKPNLVSEEEKMKWLADCELYIQRKCIQKYEGPPINPKADIELTMPAPFSDGYINYLLAKIAFNQEELDQYNVQIRMFDAQFDDFCKDYHQSHTMKQPKENRFLF